MRLERCIPVVLVAIVRFVLRLGRVGSRGWWAMYDLRFVLDGVRSLFRLVDLTCVFMFKTNSLVHPKNLYQVVFFWYRQDQKGTGGSEIYIYF